MYTQCVHRAYTPCNLFGCLRITTSLSTSEGNRKSRNRKLSRGVHASCRLNGRRLVELALAFIQPRDSPPATSRPEEFTCVKWDGRRAGATIVDSEFPFPPMTGSSSWSCARQRIKSTSMISNPWWCHRRLHQRVRYIVQRATEWSTALKIQKSSRIRTKFSESPRFDNEIFRLLFSTPIDSHRPCFVSLHTQRAVIRYIIALSTRCQWLIINSVYQLRWPNNWVVSFQSIRAICHAPLCNH